MLEIRPILVMMLDFVKFVSLGFVGDDSACGVWFDDGRDVEEGLVEAVAWDAAPAVLRKAHRSFVGSVYGVEMAYSEQVRAVWEYSEFVSVQ